VRAVRQGGDDRGVTRSFEDLVAEAGGGEVLAGVEKLSAATVATESWPPNIARVLQPGGIQRDGPFVAYATRFLIEARKPGG
jgi:hypothetical protein